MAEVQEIAQFVWDASEKLHSGTGFHLINEMITRSRDATEEQAALLQEKDQPVFSQRQENRLIIYPHHCPRCVILRIPAQAQLLPIFALGMKLAPILHITLKNSTVQ